MTTTNTATYSAPYPTVHLTVKKSRRKQTIKKSQLIYYLQDGEEFELEIFNPTQTIYKANIFLNDLLIPGGGLVLKPGERVFLDRYLNDPRKFKFETYEVGTSEPVNHAIANNGKVKVEFFKEQTLIDYSIYTNYNTTQDWNIHSPYYATEFTTTGTVFGTCSTTTTLANDSIMENSVFKSSPTPKKQETGMVGKGSKSDQEFQSVNYDFDCIPSYTMDFQILPLSKKQTMVSDINTKRYCTQCGTKYKSNHKFCSNCGNKI